MDPQNARVSGRRGLSKPSSVLRIAVLSVIVSSFVALTSVFLQWLIYDDWMHRTGPLRLVGTAVASLLTLIFVYKWLLLERARQTEMLRRFEVIAEMNDRIRNAVQAIACTSFAYHPEATHHLEQAVSAIDEALRGVVDTVGVPSELRTQRMSANKAARR